MAGATDFHDLVGMSGYDGDKYPDGSFWHQWMKTWTVGPQFYYDCVGGDEPVPGPPPPGGCGGAISPDQPAPPAT